ncbi:MAG: hypothetical protein H8E72_00025 [Candidatus Marinimicrobia bacterium]|nr:hypothetical protein [Candidatus Neomarinimicrobiota bacterium]
MKNYFHVFSYLILFINIGFSQCDTLSYSESEYYFFPEIGSEHIHVNSPQDCFYKIDWDILEELISINNLEYEVTELGSQSWDVNGRLKTLLLDYSQAQSVQFIDQKISFLPENFGDLIKLETLELWWHNLNVLPSSFTKLENLHTLRLKGNRLKILNPNFGLLSNLVTLDLGYNELISLPESISTLDNLDYLFLFENDINFIPSSICDIGLDWSGTDEYGDIFFGSGGNHLCQNIPSCIQNSSFFEIRLEPEGYATQIISEQICQCNDGTYPDCAGVCPEEINYGSITDGCGFCNLPLDTCSLDCMGEWNGISELDDCGICNGNGSECAEFGTLSLIDNDDGTWLVTYNSPYSISSINFEIEGAVATSAVGFEPSTFYYTSINEIIEGSFIPTVSSGEGTLLIVSFDSIPTSLNNIMVTDATNTLHIFVFDDGNLETCDDGFDCLGECGGSATLDVCGICDGSGMSVWYIDNDGDGWGDPQNSSQFCYEYQGYVANSLDNDDSEFCPYQYLGDSFDCFGNCITEFDCAGVCGGGATEDCMGDCNGLALEDECGICGGPGPLGECGCDDIPTGFCDCSGNIIDGCGVCGGGGVLDDCGVCNGGNAEMDDCGVCSGGNVKMDCNGDCAEDTPISCVDTTGNGQCGNATINLCGCVGGNTELEEDFCFGCRDEAASNMCVNCTEYCDETPLSYYCCEYEDLSNLTIILPTEFGIQNNYPNPFNPETTINYSIPQKAWVSLTIYSLKGELVTTLMDGVVNPGNYSAVWNGNDFTNRQMPTGIYFSILRTNEISLSHKLLLLK